MGSEMTHLPHCRGVRRSSGHRQMCLILQRRHMKGLFKIPAMEGNCSTQERGIFSVAQPSRLQESLQRTRYPCQFFNVCIKVAGVPVAARVQTLRRPRRRPKADKCYVREEKEQMEALREERQEEADESAFIRST